MAPLSAPLGTCYSWQRQLENGRQRRNFVCSGLGSGQTSGLQLSGARDWPPVPPVRPRHPRHGPNTRAGMCLSPRGGSPVTTSVLSHTCAELGILSSAPGAAGVTVGIPVSVTPGHWGVSTGVCV